MKSEDILTPGQFAERLQVGVSLIHRTKMNRTRYSSRCSRTRRQEANSTLTFLECWRRGWDSHPTLALKIRKLLILCSARNAKTAEITLFGYTAATWRAGSGDISRRYRSVGSQKCLNIQSRSKPKRGPSFLFQKPADRNGRDELDRALYHQNRWPKRRGSNSASLKTVRYERKGKPLPVLSNGDGNLISVGANFLNEGETLTPGARP